MSALEILRWLASGSGIVAAVLVAANLGRRITGLGFIIFTLSSVCWISASYFGDRGPLAAQNIVLLAINLFGVYRYLVRPRIHWLGSRQA